MIQVWLLFLKTVSFLIFINLYTSSYNCLNLFFKREKQVNKLRYDFIYLQHDSHVTPLANLLKTQNKWNYLTLTFDLASYDLGLKL